MYTIKMNARKGKWQVLLRQFGLFYWPIKGAEFGTLNEARNYVEQTGLAQHYDEQVYKGMNSWASYGVLPARQIIGG